ncbi:galactose-1-phosphate uridylyltransferase [Frankia sp. Ag45/Mut15]|uniref:Galactose-1-phosphate uridylyltransferase n=1 Tax=Frankia umida TaxID=573489 RepID=A0ABT0K6P2_9ACTN|nr:galactose-1-phosphate uridylyltransferase [Frankia umida]MCK9878988.1 galactose-1-phosphate uridylyltransferase [Frankia umida]
MTERRYDPTADEWVTFATHRQDRMYKPPTDDCPLCPSRPGGRLTEVPRAAYEVVTFDNRFPSLSPQPPAPEVAGTELYPVAPAFGRCEVVVYSDDHHTTFADLPADRVRMLVDVWADRVAVLGATPGVSYVMPFENKGEVIGVTLAHPHGQIYAYPEVPPRPARELRAASAYRDRTGRCVECDVVAAEAAGPRCVLTAPTAIAFVPFWARFPYEVHVVPRAHRPDLGALGEQERADLSGLLHRLTRGYDRLFGFSLPYVMAVHGRPTDDERDWDPVSHLHVEFTPPHRSATRLKYLAGSELAGGAFLTDVAPERAAAALRGAMG